MSIWRRGILMMEAGVFSASTLRIAFTRPAGILGYNVLILPPSPFKACWNLNRLLYKTTRGYLFTDVLSSWSTAWLMSVSRSFDDIRYLHSTTQKGSVDILDEVEFRYVLQCPVPEKFEFDPAFQWHVLSVLWWVVLCVCVWTADVVAYTFSYQSLDQQWKRSSNG